ncbi:MAG: hypothetical protein JOY80_10650 [Candidatus Dormibacteraeota bacterium]|nr:hypothetical protein [Candidatus Dormibacteraeota bacterium]
MSPATLTPIATYLEVGSKRTFAATFDWPGWCRAAKNEELALETLREYASRYAPIARAARLSLPDRVDFDVVERLRGDATTDFGAPGQVPERDHARLDRAECERLVALMRAAWSAFDRRAARAPAALRKGPRGGGRDRDAIVEHVLAAEQGYARKIGLTLAPPPIDDPSRIRAHRNTIAGACIEPPQPQPAKPWPVRYLIRRLTWHSIDHLWEIEDRT